MNIDADLPNADWLRSTAIGAALVFLLAGEAIAQVPSADPEGIDPRLLPARGSPSPGVALFASKQPPSVGSEQEARSAGGRASVPLMISGGLLGGAIGTLGGGYLGAAIVDDTCEGEGCFAGIIQGAFVGAAAAESVLLPLGVHLAAGGKGDFGTSLAASLALGAAGVGIAYATHVDDPLGAGLLMAVPLAQITVSVMQHR